MSLSAPIGRAWDEASGAASDDAVRKFETAWRSSRVNRRPDPLAFAGGGNEGVRLALLRADLTYRWEAGERAGAGRYRGLNLSDDAMVALAYEEYCLREDGGETPDPNAFYERFPEVAPALRRVLEIHDLVGSGGVASTASLGLSPCVARVPFPEAGQTIAGFSLVEELGRGGFARVFLAKERQLGDRLVALKVARSGSREPQTLARLQHTHIVPVHSYRIDPATGLHLLCMPYFGRVTLARLLADKAVADAETGAELAAALDRLDDDSATGSSPRPAGRMALASRSYPRAIAWWGARLAEALQHAHDRGVLHRDVKPSNVLLTADGMPMLLDFNLAHEPVDVSDDEASPAALGGTVAYMSPEHLEALAEGRTDGVDARSDIYALGVVLFEAMGVRPFGPPPTSRSMHETLLRTAEDRRSRVPRLALAFPEAPPALDSVVARCLHPDPDQRYASAGDLAEDLQAVADDLPLVHAREPVAVRLWAKVRRHRRAMIATSALLIAVGVSALSLDHARMVDQNVRDRFHNQIAAAEGSEKDKKFGQAARQFEAAAGYVEGSRDLKHLWDKARLKARTADLAARTQTLAEDFFDDARLLRLALLDVDGDRPEKAKPLSEVLAPFFVFSSHDWTDGDLDALSLDARARLVREVHELLFLAALHAAIRKTPDHDRIALALCDKASDIRAACLASRPPRLDDASTLPEGPWRALGDRVKARLDGRALPIPSPPPPEALDSPWESYQWGRLLQLDGRGWGLSWLNRAAWPEGGPFWLKFDVAYRNDRLGHHDTALELYSAALQIEPTHLRALVNRARLYREKGELPHALENLSRVLKADDHLDEARLERGLIYQSLGRMTEARKDYDTLLEDGHSPDYGRAARLNRAKLDADAGRLDLARSAYNTLIATWSDDFSARLGRAMLALRSGDAASAETDLNVILAKAPQDVDALALRALCLLAQRRLDAAERDAEEAARLDPSPRNDRLHQRTILAMGRYDALRIEDPDEVRLLPSGGPSLAAALRSAVSALGRGEPTQASRSTRASILAALGEPAEAEAEATRAVESEPNSPRARLVRARVRRDRGDRPGAMSDVAAGLAFEPDDPRLVGLRGLLLIESRDPSAALVELNRATLRGGGPALDYPRALARSLVGKPREALADWNLLLGRDGDDPSAYLGRARSLLALGFWDRAMADLERAADASGERPSVLVAVLMTYARCLPARSDHVGRVLALARRAVAGVRPRPGSTIDVGS